MRHRFSHPSPALVLSVLALFAALGGTTYAALPKGSAKAAAAADPTATIYHESMDIKTIGANVTKFGPAITIPDVGQVTFACSNDPASGLVFLTVRYRNTTGGDQKAFIDTVRTAGNESLSDETAPGHHTMVIGQFTGPTRYSVQVLGASRLINLTGVVDIGAGCRNAAQAVFTN